MQRSSDTIVGHAAAYGNRLQTPTVPAIEISSPVPLSEKFSDRSRANKPRLLGLATHQNLFRSGNCPWSLRSHTITPRAHVLDLL
jgi:hypothetical protein